MNYNVKNKGLNNNFDYYDKEYNSENENNSSKYLKIIIGLSIFSAAISLGTFVYTHYINKNIKKEKNKTIDKNGRNRIQNHSSYDDNDYKIRKKQHYNPENVLYENHNNHYIQNYNPNILDDEFYVGQDDNYNKFNNLNKQIRSGAPGNYSNYIMSERKINTNPRNIENNYYNEPYYQYKPLKNSNTYGGDIYDYGNEMITPPSSKYKNYNLTRGSIRDRYPIHDNNNYIDDDELNYNNNNNNDYPHSYPFSRTKKGQVKNKYRQDNLYTQSPNINPSSYRLSSTKNVWNTENEEDDEDNDI